MTAAFWCERDETGWTTYISYEWLEAAGLKTTIEYLRVLNVKEGEGWLTVAS